MKWNLLILFAIFVAPAFAASGDSYASCDAPLGNYKCYAPGETQYCPGQGLEYVKGWCSDPPGKVTRCCAPSGTPEGKRTGSPGIQVSMEKPKNLVNQDFELFLEGTLSCEYTVKSGNNEPVKRQYPCDSYVKITIGPNGDCRHEGTDTCMITNDGGYLGRQQVHTLSIEFKKPSVKSYGVCRKYTSSQCVEEGECKISGGTPIRGYCPGTSRNIKCCVYQVTETRDVSNRFIFDKTKDKILQDISLIDSQLRTIKERHNVKIIIEIVDALPQDADQNLRDKFHRIYGLDESSATGMEMLIMYSRSQDVWRGFGFRGCTMNEDLLEKIVSEEIVSKNVRQGNYAEALKNFAGLLEGAISRKISSGDICKPAASAQSQTCMQQCSAFSFGPINLCTREKCVNIDGCVWNSGSCDDICDPKKSAEAVVIKKDEQCANGETCPDIYLCKDGKVSEGYPIKASSGANLGNKIKRGDKRTPEGTFEILEKLQVIDLGNGQFKYVDENGNDVQPKCDLSPAVTGIRDYWMHLSYPDRANAANNDDPRGSCIGIHGSTSDLQYTLGCVKIVEKDKISDMFRNLNLGDSVSIKDPYKVERQARSASSNIITGGVVAQGTQDEFSATCSAVCSGVISSAAYSLGIIDCPKRCSQLGCIWENEKCVSSPSICKLTQKTALKEVIIVSSVNGGPADDKNKVVANDDVVILYALMKLQNTDGIKYISNSEITEAVVKGAMIKVGRLGGRVDIKWFQIEPQPKHFVDDEEECPDVGPEDQNYCWYQNLKSSKFWVGGADAVVYDQIGYGTGWSVKPEDIVGTSRYRAEVTLNGVTVSSPGAPDENTKHKLKSSYYSAGIADSVHRISRRSDFDTTCQNPFKNSDGCKLVSYLHSYAGVPWIWGASEKQRNLYVGFDCAELPAGAYYQMTGKKLTGISAHRLATDDSVTKAVTGRVWFSLNPIKNTVDSKGNKITVKVGNGENELRIGDLLLLDYDSNGAYDHTTIFISDNGNGVLDLGDELTTSCHTVGLQAKVQAWWEKLVNICPLVSDNPITDKQTNARSICRLTPIQEMLKKGLNVAYVIRRFNDYSSRVASEALVSRLENAIRSKHAPTVQASVIQGNNYNAARQWAETITKYSKNKENAALIAAMIEKETLGEFAADPYIGIGETLGKWVGATDSLGCMQVQKANAEQIASENGRNPLKTTDELKTIDGCVFYGSKYLDKVLDIYVEDGKISSVNVPVIAAGYNADKYAPRNAALQEQINDLLGARTLSTTGLLLRDPEPDIKNPGPTEASIRKIMRLTDEQIRNDLKKQKEPGFESTATYTEIKKAWKARFGREPVYASVPQLREDNWISHDIDVPGYAADVLNNYKEYCRLIGCQEFT